MGIAFGDVGDVDIDALKYEVMMDHPRRPLKIGCVLLPAITVVMRS